MEEYTKEKKVQMMFSSIAGNYDLVNTILSFGLHYYWKKISIQKARLRKGGIVLDICSGTCDIALLLSREVGQNGIVFATDLNKEMLSNAYPKLIRSESGKNINRILCNAEDLNFKDNSIDSVTVGFGIRNVTDSKKAFKEMVRVLKPGGRGVCLEFSKVTNPILRNIYSFYSFKLLPSIGKLFTGDKTGIYNYLPDSIKKFPDQEELRSIMMDAGFSSVEYTNLTGGIVSIHVGIK